MPAIMHTERPAERRRQRVRRLILEAAERVFAAEGGDGLSMRRLAEEIDYSPAAIYKYFSSKEELIDAIREAFFERLLVRLGPERLAGLTFEAKCRYCLVKYVEAAIERPFHYGAAFFSVGGDASAPGRPSACLQAFGESRKGQAFLVLVSLVREGQSIGTVPAGSSAWRLAQSLWASMHGIAALLIHMPDFMRLHLPDEQRPDVAGIIAFHCDLLYRGLCQGPTLTRNGQTV